MARHVIPEMEEVQWMHGIWRGARGLKMNCKTYHARRSIFAAVEDGKHLQISFTAIEYLLVWNIIVTALLRSSVEAMGPLENVPRVTFEHTKLTSLSSSTVEEKSHGALTAK